MKQPPEGKLDRTGREIRFNGLFAAFYLPLCRLALSMLDDREQAREVVQNAFLVLWKKGDLDSPRPVIQAFLCRIVRNGCLDLIRHRRQKELYRARIMGLCLENVSDDLFAGVVGKELQEKIRLSISELPPQCRKIFVMNRLENLKYREIAGQLGISCKAVEAHISRALQLLKEKLSDYL